MKLLIVLGLLSFLSASLIRPYPPTGPRGRVYNLGQLTKIAERLTTELRNLDADPDSADIISKIFNNDTCLHNMDEAILAIEEGAKLLEEASGDILIVTREVESLMRLKDEAEIVRKVASIMRSLQPLLTHLTPIKNTQLCQSSTDQTSSYLRSLSIILAEISDIPKLAVNSEMKGMVIYSGSVVSGLTTFLLQLDRNTREFKNSCRGDKYSGIRAIKALGTIMVNLADMTAVMGGLRAGEEMREKSKVTERIVVRERFMAGMLSSLFTISESDGEDERFSGILHVLYR